MLFYSREGSFQNNDLVLTCEDIFPMDLGTSGWTEFQISADVAKYIAENIELFNCETGLIHSHHTMGAFFSGQDERTLRQEGNDTNCFLSLIVDTAGTYKARITRKISSQYKISTEFQEQSYSFFGEGKVTIPDLRKKDSVKTKTTDVIEYFDLDIELHEVPNDLAYLDDRFAEIEAQKRESSPISTFLSQFNNTTHYDDDIPYFKTENKDIKQPYLFSEEEMSDKQKSIDDSEWHPDPAIIEHMVTKLLMCSLMISNKVDINQWVEKHMVNRYKVLFEDDMQFNNWADFILDFLITNYPTKDIPESALEDDYQREVAWAIVERLNEFPPNTYIKWYCDALSGYCY